MDTYKGHIEYKLVGQKSKSEGFVANLITSTETSYRLYRKGVFEINDNFFKQFDQQEVEINGELEDSGFICVTSIKSADGNLIQVPEQPSLSPDLVFHPKEESNERTGNTENQKKRTKAKPALILKKKKKSNNNFKRRKNEYE